MGLARITFRSKGLHQAGMKYPVNRFLCLLYYYLGDFFSKIPFCYKPYNYFMIKSYDIDQECGFGEWVGTDGEDSD